MVILSILTYSDYIKINNLHNDSSYITYLPDGIVTDKSIIHFDDEFFLFIKSPDNNSTIKIKIKVNKQIFDSLNINDNVSNLIINGQ